MKNYKVSIKTLEEEIEESLVFTLTTDKPEDIIDLLMKDEMIRDVLKGGFKILNIECYDNFEDF